MSVDTVHKRLGVYQGELYTQFSSRYYPLGVMFTKTRRFMTRPSGEYFNVMGGEPAILYEDLPDPIRSLATKPTPTREPVRLTPEEHTKYADIQAGKPTKGKWVEVKRDGVTTYLPESQASTPGGHEMGLGVILIACAVALWYFLLGGIRKG